MKYQIGQAIIDITNSKYIFIGGNSQWVCSLFGNVNTDLRNKTNNYRPATEQEILDHIQQHGWEVDYFKHLRSKHGIWIAKTDHWFVNGGVDITSHTDLSIFGNECIQAHRIITALNLAKN